MVKAINRMHKTEAAAPAPPAPPTQQEVLLTEIRDLLKKK
jgi:large conductance mechanosensitive channel